MPFDVVLAGPGLEEEFLSRLETARVGRRRVPVLALEDLLLTKVIAGRDKDLDDVRALLALHPGRVDTARLVAALRTIGSAIGEDLTSRLAPILRGPRRA